MLLDRSADWPTYQLILNGAYPDLLDVTLAVSLFQMRWDKVEGSGIAHVVTAGAPTGVPPKQILMQVALADEQVPNIGSWWQARTDEHPRGRPDARPRRGALGAGRAARRRLGARHHGRRRPPTPTGNVAPPDLGMHNLTRNQPAARRQIKEFFDDRPHRQRVRRRVPADRRLQLKRRLACATPTRAGGESPAPSEAGTSHPSRWMDRPDQRLVIAPGITCRVTQHPTRRITTT